MTVSIALSSTMALALGTYMAPWLSRMISIPKLRRQLGRQGAVALTYDDGPSRVLTPELLKLLRAHSAKATFFMTGEHARRFPQIADSVVADGHQVGCHSERHLNAWLVTPGRSISDIHIGYETLSRWVPTNGMFRAPFGKITLPTYLAVRRRGAVVCWWTINSGDTAPVLPSPNDVVERVMREGGGIVLLHDIDRSEERDEFVLDTSARLIKAARREGLKISTLAELQL
jgi:peptidoglycan/xylan/chitin deacetylase (PgdA/CDA1 family)